MIPSPYNFEPALTDLEYAKLGVLALRWSHIEGRQSADGVHMPRPARDTGFSEDDYSF
jgi:hypothetical protein